MPSIVSGAVVVRRTPYGAHGLSGMRTGHGRRRLTWHTPAQVTSDSDYGPGPLSGNPPSVAGCPG